MNVLAIETATPTCAVALLSAGERHGLTLDNERRHGEVLSGGISTLLERAAIRAAEIDRVVVDRGPGLFTGLRVGVATAVAFALASGAELVGVTSLELLARGAWRAGVRGRLYGVVDARRGEIFIQGFSLGADVVALDAPRVATPGEWDRNPDVGGVLTLTGDGAARYRDAMVTRDEVSVFDQSAPPVDEALDLALVRASGDVAPLYLRDADAVANFATRERPS